ncbi:MULTISPECIES: polyprenyl synthetase family protein [Streptomyces]|uniref:Geranylgeranyl pyrophosphate synthase n=1 Tax=Streptomyces venezuelae TaxID=54571 RepID=A0A5P2B5E8_STRVZ|nr:MULTISPECIES: polyprenyl synthetase family protein [Streptomyces]NEA00205.1 polyprenyl synthetase family protein [Streptomyces sp. SID10116]MYY84954.1 polyprenyl synthetase family protein [Streptomyces sp. SID335]MYZ16816.1 polyprenyl synthetase family protein [Streptomyces sp. SID337]NDZ83978.1 polyprenyl synthetase family protein [Streptomyces sp. SID10115]NEB45294.1 polyprenyl synthetase family protein [Streptomyces sp. SID339]
MLSGPAEGTRQDALDGVSACDIDADVSAAVHRTLEGILHGRLEEARSIDPAFAGDIADRVARFTLRGGKRIRSRFLWWGLRACAGGAGPGQVDAALRLAAGLELIQTCALVHDDVMDGSPLRRGRDAVHVDLQNQYGASEKQDFGTAAAILAGDLALSWADDVVAATVLDPARAHRVRGLWRAMRAEMVAGQYLDLRGQATGTRSMTGAVRTAVLKTALYSVERPLALGAALAGADDATTGALCSAGRCAGIAFQLRDDLFGAFGDPGETGKPSGDDIRDGKGTYLLAVATARAEAAADHDVLALLDRCVGRADLSEDDVREVREAFVTTGARGIVEDKIRKLVGQAHRHLAAGALVPHADRRLHELFRGVAGLPVSGATADPHLPLIESGSR